MYDLSTQSEISLNYAMVSWHKVYTFHYNFVKKSVFHLTVLLPKSQVKQYARCSKIMKL